jgi:hypothetical protein
LNVKRPRSVGALGAMAQEGLAPMQDQRIRDFVPGQVTVVMPGGRVFAVIGGRRWTRVPEYLSNGQLTARWFVDESTGEVRMAEGWKSPKSWPIGGDAAEFVRAIVGQARGGRRCFNCGTVPAVRCCEFGADR